ncbi:hypothetical protein [Tahibacter amnicola]|uniref:Membrane protein YqjE n=1 Tax=Tahibacter amnicola TaxID=2976241 RepID=A0ABY6BK58_9GAMM|nr:hypothetical protein [Tahibacter amnicola]UXI69991.1 hypothetical protein N4264_10300 [Tahibacter amnicola]
MASSEEGATEPLRRRRRGALMRWVRLLGMAGDVLEALAGLLRAETRLAKSAVPHAVIGAGAVLVLSILLISCGWLGLLLWLYQLTGSVGLALMWLSIASAVLLGLAVWRLVRALRALSFPETRTRIHAWLERSDHHGVDADDSTQ